MEAEMKALRALWSVVVKMSDDVHEEGEESEGGGAGEEVDAESSAGSISNDTGDEDEGSLEEEGRAAGDDSDVSEEEEGEDSEGAGDVDAESGLGGDSGDDADEEESEEGSSEEEGGAGCAPGEADKEDKEDDVDEEGAEEAKKEEGQAFPVSIPDFPKHPFEATNQRRWYRSHFRLIRRDDSEKPTGRYWRFGRRRPGFRCCVYEAVEMVCPVPEDFCCCPLLPYLLTVLSYCVCATSVCCGVVGVSLIVPLAGTSGGGWYFNGLVTIGGGVAFFLFLSAIALVAGCFLWCAVVVWDGTHVTLEFDLKEGTVRYHDHFPLRRGQRMTFRFDEVSIHSRTVLHPGGSDNSEYETYSLGMTPRSDRLPRIAWKSLGASFSDKKDIAHVTAGIRFLGTWKPSDDCPSDDCPYEPATAATFMGRPFLEKAEISASGKRSLTMDVEKASALLSKFQETWYSVATYCGSAALLGVAFFLCWPISFAMASCAPRYYADAVHFTWRIDESFSFFVLLFGPVTLLAWICFAFTIISVSAMWVGCCYRAKMQETRIRLQLLDRMSIFQPDRWRALEGAEAEVTQLNDRLKTMWRRLSVGISSCVGIGFILGALVSVVLVSLGVVEIFAISPAIADDWDALFSFHWAFYSAGFLHSIVGGLLLVFVCVSFIVTLVLLCRWIPDSRSKILRRERRPEVNKDGDRDMDIKMTPFCDDSDGGDESKETDAAQGKKLLDVAHFALQVPPVPPRLVRCNVLVIVVVVGLVASVFLGATPLGVVGGMRLVSYED